MRLFAGLFAVEKVELGQVFSEYFDFLCQFSFHRLLHIHHHLSPGAATIGELVADVPGGLSVTPSQKLKKYITYMATFIRQLMDLFRSVDLVYLIRSFSNSMITFNVNVNLMIF
jgi:hypothetical protein